MTLHEAAAALDALGVKGPVIQLETRRYMRNSRQLWGSMWNILYNQTFTDDYADLADAVAEVQRRVAGEGKPERATLEAAQASL